MLMIVLLGLFADCSLGFGCGFGVCWCLQFGGGCFWWFVGVVGWFWVLVVGLHVMACLCVVLCFLFGLSCWFAVGCAVLVVMRRFCAGFRGVLVCFGLAWVLICWLYLRGFVVLFVLRYIVLMLLVLVFSLGFSCVGYVARGFCFGLWIMKLVWVTC